MTTRIALVLTALVGVFICGVLLQLTVAGTNRSMADVWCKPTATVNCSHVLASKWSKVGFLPTAQIGMIYFACAAAWYGFIGIPNRRGRAWQLLPIAITGVGLLGSAFFLFVMSRLPVWCTWCAAAHAANFLLFVLSIAGWFAAKGEGEASPKFAHVGAVAGMAFLIGVIVLLGGSAYRQQQAAAQFQELYADIVNDVDYIVWRHATSPRFDIPIRDDDLIEGPADAVHSLVIFSDFECEACASLHQNIAGLVASFPDALRVVLRHYPVCRACNPHVDRDFHFFSCDAAVAAEAVREVADRDVALKYWNLLFRNQDHLDENPYADLARDAGLNLSAFEAARSGDDARRRVQEDIELAHRLGVEGTPTLFLDGRRLPQWGIVDNRNRGRPDREATLRLWNALLGMQRTGQSPSNPRSDAKDAASDGVVP